MLPKSYLLFFILGVISSSLLLTSVYAQESNTVRLFPTDDTFVIADVNDPDDIKGLQKRSLGDLDVLTTWYSWNVSDETKIFSITYLKFDLNNISSREIESATLLLYANKTQIVERVSNFAIYSLNGTSWSEKDLSYDDNVAPLERISDITAINEPGLYEWDITQYVINNAGSEIAIAANFDKIIDKKAEVVTFISKDSPSSNYRPVLIIETLSEKDIQRNIAISELEKQIAELKQPETIEDENLTSTDSNFNIINITPTDDAFVVANLNDPENVEGSQSINTGDLEYLRSWYAWNVTENQERITTLVYLKFDLAEIDSEGVLGAQLKLKPFVGKSTIGLAPKMELTFVPENNWSELEITYDQRPLYFENFTKISSVITEDERYSWDLTDLVKENAGSELSIAFAIRDIYTNNEELITFHSKEAEDPENFPVLEIEYAAAIPPIPSSLQENETDYTLAAIVGVLVAAAAGIGIFIALILRKKSPKQLRQVTTTPSEKPRMDSQKQKPSQERKCILCGKTLAQDFKVCPYCGYRV